jgi:DNA-binding MarR family transcriptional regulator
MGPESRVLIADSRLATRDAASVHWTRVTASGFAIAYGKMIWFDKPTLLREATPVKARDAVMTLYPRIYFACHTRHVRDPQDRRLLSRHQASILDHLDELAPTSVLELARHMGVTPGTMSLAIDRLERKGYVVRLRDSTDRRRVHVRLTGAGVRVRNAASVLDPERVDAVLGHLTEDERARAIHGLELLARASQQEMASRVPDFQTGRPGL